MLIDWYNFPATVIIISNVVADMRKSCKKTENGMRIRIDEENNESCYRR